MTKKAINKKRVIKKMKSVNSKPHWRKSRLKNLLKRDFASRKSEFGRRAQFPESRSRNSLRDRFRVPLQQWRKLETRNQLAFNQSSFNYVRFWNVIWQYTYHCYQHLIQFLSENWYRKKRQSGGGILLWSLKKATQFLKKFINAISSGGGDYCSFFNLVKKLIHVL